MNSLAQNEEFFSVEPHVQVSRQSSHLFNRGKEQTVVARIEFGLSHETVNYEVVETPESSGLSFDEKMGSQMNLVNVLITLVVILLVVVLF